jgi:hypothetical protein
MAIFHAPLDVIQKNGPLGGLVDFTFGLGKRMAVPPQETESRFSGRAASSLVAIWTDSHRLH